MQRRCFWSVFLGHGYNDCVCVVALGPAHCLPVSEKNSFDEVCFEEFDICLVLGAG